MGLLGPVGQAGSAGPHSYEPLCAGWPRGWDSDQNLWVRRVWVASCKILENNVSLTTFLQDTGFLHCWTGYWNHCEPSDSMGEHGKPWRWHLYHPEGSFSGHG